MPESSHGCHLLTVLAQPGYLPCSCKRSHAANIRMSRTEAGPVGPRALAIGHERETKAAEKVHAFWASLGKG
jgi:hypothetical protein